MRRPGVEVTSKPCISDQVCCARPQTKCPRTTPCPLFPQGGSRTAVPVGSRRRSRASGPTESAVISRHSYVVVSPDRVMGRFGWGTTGNHISWSVIDAGSWSLPGCAAFSDLTLRPLAAGLEWDTWSKVTVSTRAGSEIDDKWVVRKK